MAPEIVQARPDQVALVSSILTEAAEWAQRQGIAMWRPDETSPDAVSAHVEAGLFFLAFMDGEAQGTLRFQLSDPVVWPELTDGSSAFVHRLAVRRAFARTGLSSALLAWAADRARRLGRTHLRLDCDPRRPKLRAIYERNGFRHHSQVQAGPLLFARFELDLRRPQMPDRLFGRVQPGKGDASKWLGLFNAEYVRKTGMPTFPGSLNVALADPFDWFVPDVQRRAIWFGREEYGGERDVLLVRCVLESMDGEPAFLWTTTTALQNRPEPHVVELLAGVHLRSAYDLRDGDEVCIRLLEPS